MNNSRSADYYQDKITRKILKSVKILCKECTAPQWDSVAPGIMMPLYLDDARIGYVCKNCSHYYLFDNEPV